MTTSSAHSKWTTSYGMNVLFTALAPMLWGTTYIVTTQFLPADKPLLAALMRVLPAGIVLMAIVRQLPKREQWWRMIVLSFLNICCFQALLFVSAYRLPGGIAAVISAVQPLIIVLLLWQIDRVTPQPMTLLSIGGAIVGMAMLLITDSVVWDGIGLLAAALGAVSMGIGVYLTKRWKPNVSNLTFTGWQLLFGGVMLLPLTLCFESLPATLTAKNIFGYLYLGIFGSLLAYSLWFRGIDRLSSVAVSILNYLSPITATIVGWYWLNQDLSLFQLCGFVLVLASVFMVQRNAKALKS